jgi:putative chitinase
VRVLLIGAPWWVRWLVTALLLAPILTVPVPDAADSAGWAWVLVILGIYSVGVAAALQRPVQHLTAFDGLSRPQRSEAVRAHRRVGTLSMAHQRRARQWHRTSRWWVPVLWGLQAAVGFLRPAGQDAQHLQRRHRGGAHRRRFQRGRGGAGVGPHRSRARRAHRYRGRHLRQHLEPLRAAAKSARAAAIASAHAEDSIALPPQRLWLSAPVAIMATIAIIAIIAIVPLVVVSNDPTPIPEVRTANADSTFDDSSIPTGDPSLSRYAANNWLSPINYVMRDADITTPDERAAFLAQIAESSGQSGQRMLNELPSALLQQWNDGQPVRDSNPSLSRRAADKWLPWINMAMHEANITTPDQEAAFLAQIAEESGGLGMVNELPWGLPRAQWNDEQAVRGYFNNKYANMNGNGGVSSGDGYNYRGRGILQITGKSNYAAVSEKLYGDDRFVKNPDLLSRPDEAAAAAAAYWNENDLNRFIPPGQPVTPQQFQDLGSTINTGHPGDMPNNAAERVKYWEVAKEALGLK